MIHYNQYEQDALDRYHTTTTNVLLNSKYGELIVNNNCLVSVDYQAHPNVASNVC